MTVEGRKVSELPFSGTDKMIHPPYWEVPPDDWFASIYPLQIVYGNGIVGSNIIYMAFEPEIDIHYPLITMAYGEIVVHDVRDADIDRFNQSIDDGEIVGRFGHYTRVRRDELTGGAPECPAWHESSCRAAGFAWGYVRGEDNDR